MQVSRYQTVPARTNFPPVSQIDQNRRHGKEHGNAARDGDDFEPRRCWGLQDVVCPDVCVDHEQGPEPQQGEGVAVKRGPAGDGDDVVGDGHGKRSQEQSHDAVSVKPGQNTVGDARDGTGERVPHGVPEKIDEGRENKGAEDIPHGNIQDLFFPALYRLEEIVKAQAQRSHHNDIHGPDPFGILPVLGEPEG